MEYFTKESSYKDGEDRFESGVFVFFLYWQHNVLYWQHSVLYWQHNVLYWQHSVLYWQHSVLYWKQCSVLTSQWSVLTSQCSVLTAQCSVLTAQCSVLTAQCSLLTAQCSVLTAQCSVLTAQCSVLTEVFCIDSTVFCIDRSVLYWQHSILYWHQTITIYEVFIFFFVFPLNSVTEKCSWVEKNTFPSPSPPPPTSYVHWLREGSEATFVCVSCGEQRSRSGPGSAVPLFSSHISYHILRPVTFHNRKTQIYVQCRSHLRISNIRHVATTEWDIPNVRLVRTLR
jgi:hypothetical protein